MSRASFVSSIRQHLHIVIDAVLDSALPRYWLSFDGSGDYVTFTGDGGKTPSSALTVEAWVTLPSPGFGDGAIVDRSTTTFDGYKLVIDSVTIGIRRLEIRPYIEGPTGGRTTLSVDNAYTTLPVHVAMSWDGSYIYVFCNGCLVGQITSSSTSISYNAGGNFRLGIMGAIWPWSGKISTVRISDSCRYTATFTDLPTTFSSDANTVALWQFFEGTGTSLADDSANEYSGTITGATWGDEADLAPVYGSELWGTVSAFQTAAAENVYLTCTGTDAYSVYYKLSSGKWIRRKYVVSAAGGLQCYETFSVTPTPSGETPDNWTGSTEVAFQGSGSVNEYAILTNTLGLSGGDHGNETVSSYTWTVDGVDPSLTTGQWANGEEVKYSHTSQIGTARANITFSATHTSGQNYVVESGQIEWTADENLSGSTSGYYGMISIATGLAEATNNNTTALDTTNATEKGWYRSSCIAAWGETGDHAEMVAALYYPDVTDLYSLGRSAGAFVGDNNKIYIGRGTGLDLQKSGTTQSWECYKAFLDDCGSHSLKLL